MDYQDMFLLLLCHTNTGILGYQSLPPNTVHRNSSCMTIFLYIKNIPADFTLLDHVNKTRGMIGQNLRS